MARTNNITDFLTDVADAIKEKTGDSTAIPASQFDTKIASIETGGIYQEKSLTINQNGNYVLSPDTGYDAISNVNLAITVEDEEYDENLSLSRAILGAYDRPAQIITDYDTSFKITSENVGKGENYTYLTVLSYTSTSYYTSAVLTFDLSNYSLNLNDIEKVELYAYYYYNDISSRHQTHPVRRIIRDWTANARMDYSYVSDTIVGSLASSGYGWRHCDVTDLVKDWYNNPLLNYGLMIDNVRGKSDAGGYWASMRYYSKEYDPAYAPKLVFTYKT